MWWGGVGCVLARVRGFDRNIRGVDNSVNTSPPEAFLNRRPLSTASSSNPSNDKTKRTFVENNINKVSKMAARDQ